MLWILMACAGMDSGGELVALEECSDGDADCDGIVLPWDCDDSDPAVGVPDRYYPDQDGDGYGVWLGALGACEHPGVGFVDCLGRDWDGNACPEMDCDDLDPAIGPECPAG
jgi:hypothetical protein